MGKQLPQYGRLAGAARPRKNHGWKGSTRLQHRFSNRPRNKRHMRILNYNFRFLKLTLRRSLASRNRPEEKFAAQTRIEILVVHRSFLLRLPLAHIESVRYHARTRLQLFQ